jgi:hypothetical protein
MPGHIHISTGRTLCCGHAVEGSIALLQLLSKSCSNEIDDDCSGFRHYS